MGKRKGNQQDSRFAAMTDAEFTALYEARNEIKDSKLRKAVERHAKATGLRNPGKDRQS